MKGQKRKTLDSRLKLAGMTEGGPTGRTEGRQRCLKGNSEQDRKETGE